MGAEIGDVIASDGRVGEVVDMIDGRAVVRPFPPRGQEALPPGPTFTAGDDARVLTKHWERETSVDRNAEQLATLRARMARERTARQGAISDRYYERHRERDR